MFTAQNIVHPVLVNLDEISAKLDVSVVGNATRQLQNVRIFRKMNGWEVELCIEVEGKLVHNSLPSKGEINEWSRLVHRAMEQEDQASAAFRRDITVPACKALFV